MARPIALITGASAGLGRTFAGELANEDRYDLVLVARRAERLEQVSNEVRAIWANKRPEPREVRTIPVDLERQDEREQLVQRLAQSEEPVEFLINNAGFGSVGRFSETDLISQERMVTLNCIAPVHLTRALIQPMLKRRRGVVLNVCSTAAFQPVPYMATYAATKAFLLSFSAATNREVRREGVLVSALCPGPTRTEFHLVAGLPEKMSYLPAMSAEAVVRQALGAIAKRQAVYINGVGNRLLAALSRVLPLGASGAIVEAVLRKHR